MPDLESEVGAVIGFARVQFVDLAKPGSEWFGRPKRVIGSNGENSVLESGECRLAPRDGLAKPAGGAVRS